MVTTASPTFTTSGIDARIVGGVLTIGLGAVSENYRAIAKVCAPAHAAGVVKADAYGLGMGRVASALAAAGCEDFFVALPHEGVELRERLPEARIFVLDGMFGTGAESVYAKNELIPILNSKREATIWERFCGQSGRPLPCAVNVDTGMNRLGMTPAEAASLADDNQLTRSLEIVLVMSHLACADVPSHPMNRRQAESFQAVRASFRGIDSSLVNSAGVFHGRQHHLDLVRPGIAVYGGAPLSGVRNPMRAVVTAEARIAQIRRAKAGETVSYGATTTLERDTAIAVAAIGYADGYHRAGSGSGVASRGVDGPAGHGWIQGRRVPILGRVTMDLTMFDVTDCGMDAVKPGDMIELFGRHIPIDEAATAAGTISYELLTGLGRRYHRVYVGGERQPG